MLEFKLLSYEEWLSFAVMFPSGLSGDHMGFHTCL